MRDVVIVFARAPRLGTVKRRLARELGERAALRFHRQTMTRLLRQLARDKRFMTIGAVTPDRACLRLPAGVRRMDQGSGDLGQRMDRAFRRFPHRRAVLVGCDIPELGRNDIIAGLLGLGRAQAVFGPAADGGYYLVGFGSRRPARPFRNVRWSSPHALADTLRNIRPLKLILLRTLHDVDTAADLRALGEVA